MGFYRKKKVGIFNVGVSTKGIGISTGIKGLRIGISSAGTPYVSAGLCGFNYRKSLATNKNKTTKNKKDTLHEEKKEILEQDNIYGISLPQQLDIKQKILLLVFFISIFLAIKLKVFVLVACLSLLGTLRITLQLRKCNALISKVKYYISVSDIISVEKILKKVNKNLKYKELISLFYQETYLLLLQEIVSDNEITTKELELIELYKDNLAENNFTETNSYGIDLVIANILSDGKITDKEKRQLDFAIKNLPLTESKSIEITSLVKNLEKIIEINKKGLSCIKKQDSFDGTECFYKGKITNITRHSKKGIISFEEVGTSDLYIDNTFLHFIENGHKKIQIGEIIKTELQEGLICFIIKNRQKPLYIKTHDSLLILSIISCIQHT